jgi:crotonobetainyl-CoA:carnitine CoA-transferase CaiB-like acyl-CoA transferase
MVAVHSGVGQVVDVNLLESMLHLMGPLLSAHALTGYLQPRLGSGIPYSVPRNTYRCADGSWVAISTTAESVAQRFLALVGAPDDPRFDGFAGRAAHREEIDRLVAEWVGRRTRDEVLAETERAEVAAAPVYSMADIVVDPHLAARGAIVEVDGVPMQDVIARLSATPGGVRFAARALGADNDEVLGELDGRDPTR